MFSKCNPWIFVFVMLFFVGLLSLTGQVSAAPLQGATSNSCLTCHEDLYYLHDTGKISCITEHADRCVNCHEGDAAVMNQDASHLGMIVHPQQNDGEKCLQCHPDDTPARLNTYASSAGFQTVIKTEPYTPRVQAISSVKPALKENGFTQNWPWFLGSMLAFGFWLILVLRSPQKP